MKNILTILGGVLTACGPIVTTQVPYKDAYWIGLIMTAVGGALLGARGFIKTPPSK